MLLRNIAVIACLIIEARQLRRDKGVLTVIKHRAVIFIHDDRDLGAERGRVAMFCYSACVKMRIALTKIALHAAPDSAFESTFRTVPHSLQHEASVPIAYKAHVLVVKIAAAHKAVYNSPISALPSSYTPSRVLSPYLPHSSNILSFSRCV